MADLIRAVELSKYFEVGKNRWLHAVDHVSFTIPEGKTMGVVGESGCGKSTLGRVILGFFPATGAAGSGGGNGHHHAAVQMRPGSF